ncbi:MAG: hypothetical protein P8010_11850 [Desulfosarcinaceae bacterium]|jgi:hypothetical protein
MKVSVLIKEKSKHYEGLRTCLGLLLEDFMVNMIVIGDEIEVDEAYEDNLEILQEFEGKYFSDNKANVKKYGFQDIDCKMISELVYKSDKVIPF